MHPLLQRRGAILVELANLTADLPGGKPSYQIEGQAVDHTEYRLSLYRELELIDQALDRESPAREEFSTAQT